MQAWARMERGKDVGIPSKADGVSDLREDVDRMIERLEEAEAKLKAIANLVAESSEHDTKFDKLTNELTHLCYSDKVKILNTNQRYLHINHILNLIARIRNVSS